MAGVSQRWVWRECGGQIMMIDSSCKIEAFEVGGAWGSLGAPGKSRGQSGDSGSPGRGPGKPGQKHGGEDGAGAKGGGGAWRVILATKTENRLHRRGGGEEDRRLDLLARPVVQSARIRVRRPGKHRQCQAR